MRPRFMCLIAAIFGLVVSVVATTPFDSASLTPLRCACFWPSIPGAYLSHLVLPEKYTMLYCFTEPPPERNAIVRSQLSR